MSLMNKNTTQGDVTLVVDSFLSSSGIASLLHLAFLFHWMANISQRFTIKIKDKKIFPL